MYDLKSIQQAKEATGQKREFSADELYENALVLMDNFSKSNKIDYLKQASENLVKVIKYNAEHGQAYLCSSYIFYVLENYEFALKYFETGEKLLPELPKQFLDFKDKLSSSIHYERNTFKNLKYEPPKTVVSKQSNFWNVMKKVF